MIFFQKLVNRYQELKNGSPDCLLLMQVGAFMQVINEDARAISQVTGLKLRMAGEVDAPIVLGGFPKSGLDAYVGKLARAGHSVAIALQAIPYPLAEKQRRFHHRQLPTVERNLWQSGVPVAWVSETDRRVTSINERVFVRRWSGASYLIQQINERSN